MKKAILFIVGLLLGCSSSKVQWHTGSFEQVLTNAQELNKPILVDFYSPT